MENPLIFMDKLSLRTKKFFNGVPLDPTVLGQNLTPLPENLHPLLSQVQEDLGMFWDTDLYLDQLLEQGKDMSIPLFKRFIPLSSDRYLSLQDRKIKD